VVQRFAAVARSFQSDRNIFFDALLPDIFAEGFGAHAGVQAQVFVVRGPEISRSGDRGRRFVCRRSSVLPFRRPQSLESGALS